MIRCLHCSAETSNGLALCDLCRRFAASIFDMLPVYFRNLARWRPGRAGSRPVPGSRVLYDGEFRSDGTGDRISDTLDGTVNALTTWARTLVDDRPGHLGRLLDRLAAARAAETVDEAQAVAWLCKGFDRHLTSVATLDWAGEFVRDLAVHEERLRVLTLTSVPGWYAGTCRRAGCETATYVVPGLTWVTCGGCGTTTYARDHLPVILKEARSWVARPMRLAEAAVALIDGEMSVPRLHKRISKWGERTEGKCIVPIRRLDADGDPIGPKRFRFGDVLDLLMSEGATRLDDEFTRQAS